MTIPEICWDISSVFIAVVLGVIAVLAVLLLLAVVVAIITTATHDKNKEHAGHVK